MYANPEMVPIEQYMSVRISQNKGRTILFQTEHDTTLATEGIVTFNFQLAEWLDGTGIQVTVKLIHMKSVTESTILSKPQYIKSCIKSDIKFILDTKEKKNIQDHFVATFETKEVTQQLHLI